MCTFEEVIAFLPPALRLRARELPKPLWDRVEEFRLRAGRLPTVSLEGDELHLPGEGAVTRRELELTVELVTRASAHTALEAARRAICLSRVGTGWAFAEVCGPRRARCVTYEAYHL